MITRTFEEGEWEKVVILYVATGGPSPGHIAIRGGANGYKNMARDCAANMCEQSGEGIYFF